MGKICSSCGFEVDDKFNFCPNCGSKIIYNEPQSEKYKFCPKCGSKIKEDTKICPNCEVNLDGRIKKIVNKYSKKKSINKFLDLEASASLKLSKKSNLTKVEKKAWEHKDPGFLLVYESIVGDYLKKLFLLERAKTQVMYGVGPLGYGVKFISPAEKMSFEESVKFYEQLLEKTTSELNEAKQEENFNEDEYYKKKFKECQIELLSNYCL